jgi:hypothetical protein
MKPLSLAVALCFALAAPAGARIHSAPLTPSRVILTDHTAIIFGPPRQVAPSRICMYLWSRTGAYGLAWRLDPTESPDALTEDEGVVDPTALLVWDTATGRSKHVWTMPAGFVVSRTAWLGSSDVALIEVVRKETESSKAAGRQQARRIVRIDARSGRADIVAEIRESSQERIRVEVSPVSPVAIAVSTVDISQPIPPGTAILGAPATRYRTTLSRIDATGPPHRLSAFVRRDSWVAIDWAADGSACTYVDESASPGTGSPKWAWKRIDTTTGRLDDLPAKPELFRGEPKPDVRIKMEMTGISKDGLGRVVPVLWAEPTDGGPWRVLVAADASSGDIAPGGSAVVYTDHGSLWIRRILRMPRADFDSKWPRFTPTGQVLAP